MRAALRAAVWSEHVADLAKRVHVLQRVFAKKEDPGCVKFTTHVAGRAEPLGSVTS